MTTADIRQVVLDALKRIAPEVDGAKVDPGVNLREELDIDSMDFLRFVLALHERLGLEIPETDYARLTTLSGAVAYLAEKSAP